MFSGGDDGNGSFATHPLTNDEFIPEDGVLKRQYKLEATASICNGCANGLTFKWANEEDNLTCFAGSSEGTFSTNNNASTSCSTYLSIGETHRITLIVKNMHNDVLYLTTTTDSETIEGRLPPIARITSSNSITTVGTTITFDGCTSSDLDNSAKKSKLISEYNWHINSQTYIKFYQHRVIRECLQII